MRRSISLAPMLAVALAFALAGDSAAGLSEPAAQVKEFLGFEVGEERRYVLDSHAPLPEGESAIWIIRLEELRNDPPGGTFLVHHERTLSVGPLPGDVQERVIDTRVVAQAQLTVNAHGFPEELVFIVKESMSGLGEDEYAVRYRLEGDEYLKEVRTADNQWSFEVPVLTEGRFDEVTPQGIFAFSPRSITCMAGGLAESTLMRAAQRASGRGRGGAGGRNRGSGGGTVRGGEPVPQGSTNTMRPDAGESGDAGAADVSGGNGLVDPTNPTGTSATTVVDLTNCEVDPLFGNPGLLSLVMPTVWEAGIGALKLGFLTPLGPMLFPDSDGRGGSPVSFGANGTFNINPLELFGGGGGDLEDYVKGLAGNYDQFDLNLGDKARIDVAGRSLDAWSLNLGTGLGDIQIDDAGKVLLVDLSAAGSLGDRFIRLLFPSEY